MNESSKEERKELNGDTNGLISEMEIYQKNRIASKNKISIFEFVLTTTKIDSTFEALEGYLYWGSLTEFFFWLVLISLFISNVRQMKMVWFFLYHIPRGTIGLILLHYLPKTYEAIAKINEIESDDLEEIKKQIINAYVNMVLSKEKVLKPMLISYFVLTLVSVIVDILLFCVITPDFGTKNYELPFLVLFFAVLCFIIEDFVFLLFFSSFKYTFPIEQNEAISKAIMGFFTELKVGIAIGFTSIAKKVQRNRANANVNEGNGNNDKNKTPNHINNESNSPIDVQVEIKESNNEPNNRTN